jgi:hypothetical protein
MKQVLFVLIVAVAAFVVGCQDSNMTGPVSGSGQQLDKPSPSTGFLVLKNDVFTNGHGTADDGFTFHVNGLVSYEYKVTGEGINAIMEFQIDMQVDVVPEKPILPQGSVNNQSLYQIALANKQGVIFVQREYYVPELQTKLHVVFGIAEDNSFSLESMSMDQLGSGEGNAVAGGNVIELNGEVLWSDQDAVNGSWMIAGQADYTLTPQDDGTMVVDISVGASLTPTYVSGNPVIVSGQSSDLVQVPSSQPIFLEKEYIFDNGEPESLHIRYSVSQTSVSLDAMWVGPSSLSDISTR